MDEYHPLAHPDERQTFLTLVTTPNLKLASRRSGVPVPYLDAMSKSEPGRMVLTELRRRLIAQYVPGIKASLWHALANLDRQITGELPLDDPWTVRFLAEAYDTARPLEMIARIDALLAPPSH